MGTALSCAEGSTCPPVGTTRESGFRCAPPGVRASAGAAGCWAWSRRRRTPPCPCLYVHDVFWLLSFGSYVPAPARLAPPSSGPAGPEFPSGARASLISSRNFPPFALRVDGPPRAQLRKLRQQPKTTVSLYVAGLGLAGSVDAGRSAWCVTRKNNCPSRVRFPRFVHAGWSGRR
jgi:hypothetical protein